MLRKGSWTTGKYRAKVAAKSARLMPNARLRVARKLPSESGRGSFCDRTGAGLTPAGFIWVLCERDYICEHGATTYDVLHRVESAETFRGDVRFCVSLNRVLPTRSRLEREMKGLPARRKRPPKFRKADSLLQPAISSPVATPVSFGGDDPRFTTPWSSSDAASSTASSAFSAAWPGVSAPYAVPCCSSSPPFAISSGPQFEERAFGHGGGPARTAPDQERSAEPNLVFFSLAHHVGGSRGNCTTGVNPCQQFAVKLSRKATDCTPETSKRLRQRGFLQATRSSRRTM